MLERGKRPSVDHAESSIDVEGNVDDTDGSNVHRHRVYGSLRTAL
jgi:hypothetical protein